MYTFQSRAPRPITFIKMFGADIIGGNLKALFAASGVSLCLIALLIITSPEASASYVQASVGVPEFSFSDLLREWGKALIDPAVYTSWAQIDGFFTFLANETFLSVFGGNTYSSLSRDTILGTIPNIFFVVCIITAALSVAVAIIGIKRAESSSKTIRK